MKNEPNRYPMLLSPSFKDYLWGGERLAVEYGKKTDMHPIAESWELSCHPDGYSIIANGEYKGRALAEVLGAYPMLYGAGGADAANGAGGAGGAGVTEASRDTFASDFPILIKFIDAKQNLSLQVHPGDTYARLHENSLGKNEAWYVVDCEPGATLILGLNDNVPTDRIASLIKEGTILDYANIVPVNPGDCFCVPAGLLHAIGGGVLIAEVQQSSNITYRVYDYGRLGADGKPRPLHIGRAADVIDVRLKTRNVARGTGGVSSASGVYEAGGVSGASGVDEAGGTGGTSGVDEAGGANNRICANNGNFIQLGGYSVTGLVDWQYFKLLRLDIESEARLACGSGNEPQSKGDQSKLVQANDISRLFYDIGRNGMFHALLVTDGNFRVEYDSQAQPGTVTAAKGACIFMPSGIGAYTLRGRGRILLSTI